MSALKFVDSHNMVAFLAKPTESEGFEQIATAKVKTVNGEVQLHALVDRKKVIITESTIRRDLQLEDAKEPIADEAANKENALEIDSLKRRVKKLEKKQRSRTHKLKRLFKVGRSAQVVSSEDEGLGDQEDASNQGRKITNIDQDAEVTLVDETQGSKIVCKLLRREKKHFASLRAQENRNKPPTKAQKKSTMSTYLKHMDGYKQSQLKNKSFAKIQKLFDKAMTRVNMFVDMDTELVKESSKKAEAEMAQESSSKRA
ncbi:hypothetical protein Tco_0790739 [Tanacetum coccineum]